MRDTRPDRFEARLPLVGLQAVGRQRSCRQAGNTRIMPSGEAASPGLDPGEFAGGGVLVQPPPSEMLRISFRGCNSFAVAGRPSTPQGGGGECLPHFEKRVLGS
jgi:hypothetical protein